MYERHPDSITNNLSRNYVRESSLAIMYSGTAEQVSIADQRGVLNQCSIFNVTSCQANNDHGN